MTIDDKIRDEKLIWYQQRSSKNISITTWKKNDQYEYLTGEEIFSIDQSIIIEQAKFTYSPLGKAFEKQTNTI